MTNEETAREIRDVIYDPIKFPLILRYDASIELSADNLDISFFYCQLYRNSNERFELDEEKFNQTLTAIFSTNNQLLITRTILLIVIVKNVTDVTNIFKRLLEEEEDNEHRIFNEIFFNELRKNQILILNFVEIIKSFIKRHSLNYESVYPIIKQTIETNETSPTPVDPNQLIFMDESDIEKLEKEKLEKISKNFPTILPFSMKYKEYCQYQINQETFTVQVDRDDVLKSVWSLDKIEENFDLKLRTNFNEGENDLDGPTREFINLSFEEIMKPETGLFDSRNGQFWFKYQRKMNDELRMKYRTIGILFGLSILNRITIPVHFTRYFYKKLLHRDTCISDTNLYDPKIFTSLKYVTEHQCKEEDMLDFSFVDLKDDYEIDLTDFSYVEDRNNFMPKALVDENKIEYVSKIIQWIFDLSIKDQFESFESGYRKVKTNPILDNIFTLDEIDKIVSGDRVKDWDSLKKGAKYVGGYSSDSQVIIWFWKYFDSLNEDKKCEALKFITGSASVPAGGFKDINIRIQKLNDGEEKLPIAHTCFFQIDLPEYRTYEELANGCREAFPNMRFGFA